MHFPRRPKSGSSLLFPSVIWNVITHHFRVLQEPDTYISLSLSLSLRLFSYAAGGLYIFHPLTFLSTTPTITYVNESASDRRFTEPPLSTPWLNESFYMHTGYHIISLLAEVMFKGNLFMCIFISIHMTTYAWVSM